MALNYGQMRRASTADLEKSLGELDEFAIPTFRDIAAEIHRREQAETDRITQKLTLRMDEMTVQMRNLTAASIVISVLSLIAALAALVKK